MASLDLASNSEEHKSDLDKITKAVGNWRAEELAMSERY